MITPNTACISLVGVHVDVLSEDNITDAYLNVHEE